MKKLIEIVLSAVVATAVIPAFGADVQTRLIRFGYGLNEDSNQGRAARTFADEVEKAQRRQDEGARLRRGGARSRRADAERPDRRRAGDDGRIDRDPCRHVKEFGVYDLPFLFTNEKEADAVLDGPVGAELCKIARAEGSGRPGLLGERLSQPDEQEAPDHQGGGLRRHQAARDAEPDLPGHFNSLGANAVRWRSRNCSRAGNQDRRRPGEPVHDDPVASSTKCRST